MHNVVSIAEIEILINLIECGYEWVSEYYVVACCSGSWQSSSGFLPHTLHSPRLFLIIGLLVAQLPLNSLPVTICRMLIRQKAPRKTEKMIAKVESIPVIVILYLLNKLNAKILKEFYEY